jgi:hypothetical protein
MAAPSKVEHDAARQVSPFVLAGGLIVALAAFSLIPWLAPILVWPDPYGLPQVR